ncbi:ABCB1, partial [Symbiodinium pilosum]
MEYLYFPAADNGRPAVLFLLFIVHDMMGCIAAVDSIVDPTCDFRGGASDQREIPQTHISAKDFWLELQAGHTDGEQDKWHQTVRGILLSHPESLADLPHLVDLLPDPRERAAMSKRRWEKLLRRSRVFLDMFEEKRYALLFQYMHAEAKKLAQDNKSLLSNIPHPEEIASSDRRQWRWDVSLAVVRLQLLLAHMERERAAQDTRDTSASSPPAAASTDAFGGSDSINFAQRKRLQSSWLDACRRKAARLASPNNGLLPMLRRPTTFTFPCSPDSFDAGAAPDVDVLKLLRAHPRDSRIRFQASDHTYYIGGVQTKGSVTGVIHTFCTPFEADSVITNVMNGARWPRAGHLKHEVSFTNMSRLSALCPVLLDLYAGSPRNDARISGLLQELARNHDIEDELLQLTLSREEIKAMWAAAGQEAAHYGTYMHYIEWTVYGEEEQLAGSIDFCARLADGSLMLVDWKRASGLQSKYSSPQCMRPPLSHMVRAEHISLDVLGGACAVTLHGDLMWLLPRFFDEYGDLRTLAKCNRELRNIILTKKYWWGAHVSLCVGELADNPVALRNAVSLFEEAAARTLDLCQIPCLNAMADRVLVNWLAQQLRLPGNDVQGWVSTHPLLGAVRFGLKLPRATRSIYIGALDAGSVACADFDNDPWSTAGLPVPGVNAGFAQSARLPHLCPRCEGCVLEDFLGGASQDSAASDALPPVGGLPGEVEPPQSLVAREDTFQADIDVEANSGISQDLEDAMDLVCDEQNIRLERARKRRLLPGADTTMHDFQKFFGDLFEVAEHRLADVPQLACEDEPSIPDRISRVRAIIARKFPRLDEALMRLVFLDLWALLVCPLMTTFWKASVGYCRATTTQPESSYWPAKMQRLATFQGQAKVAEYTTGRTQKWRARRQRQAQLRTDVAQALPAGLADALTKAGYTMQNELLRDRIFNLVVEWCDSPQTFAAGISYTDCAFLYDVRPGQHVTAAKGVPEDNIYVHIPHPLRSHELGDPALAAAQNALIKFYSETFWLNNDEDLAHTDVLFGVGQSLYSAHLDAVYGPNHRFIDPNIWYNEEETRKQVSQCAGCFILTAQEKPETGRKMREDLFKKACSADGVAGRPPYGMTTRMIELVCWLRYEARFIDSQIIASCYPDANMDGYFAKNDELKDFLKSGPCIAAALLLQHAFEAQHSRQECRQLIEDYAAKPLTEDMMRKACGLSPRCRSDETNTNAETLQIPVETTSQQERDDLQKKLANVRDVIVKDCLAKQKSLFTKGMTRYLSLPVDHPTTMTREAMYDALVQHGFLVMARNVSAKYKGSSFPRLDLKYKLGDLVPLKASSPVATHHEIHDLEAAR